MTDDSFYQSGQGPASERRSWPTPAPCPVACSSTALVTRVRSVRASSISIPPGRHPSRPTGRSHGGDGADHTQASIEHRGNAAEVCEKQWPNHGSDRDACVERVSGCSKKAWLSRAQEAARCKSKSTMRLIACSNRSSPKPTTFWCPFGNAPLADA